MYTLFSFFSASNTYTFISSIFNDTHISPTFTQHDNNMASSNKDNSIEYDKQMYKKPEKPKNHLAGRLNKFQETINQTQARPTPVIHSIHDQQEIPPNIMNEIKYIYQLIKDNGTQGDYALQIKFSELIPVRNEK
ncbi:hypothetical protein I4U23_020036 [Adineta vaga]|nr:hypothetical protein I4U23_020036 [Adineta vaga]